MVDQQAADEASDVHDVFISYAGPDRRVAAVLAASLEHAGVGVWWDDKLRADEPFEEQIQRVLSGTKLVVAVLSPHALRSEWVRWELSQASENGLHILPLLVDDARPADLPPPLDLLPTLVAGDGADAMRGVASDIRERLEKITRAPSRWRENDARRRLASAAGRTARLAANIKQRKADPTALPPIVIASSGDHAPSANRYTMSDGFAALLRDRAIALAFTSLQTNEIYLLGSAPDRELVVDVQAFRKPTGLFVGRSALLVGTLAHVYRLENILRPGQSLDGMYSRCYVPRVGFFTGVVDTHDVGESRGGAPLFVATRCNCLATTSEVHSFRPVWRPSFISAIVAEDRCHLNGLALIDGAPAYVTAGSTTDTYDGWRGAIDDGGVVIDVRSDKVVCEGLSLPHSPRVHDGRLWLLNSAQGEAGFVSGTDSSEARFCAVAKCPGFTRGLAFDGRYAIVGVSRPRYDDVLGAGPMARLHDTNEGWCGLQVIDTESGACVQWFRVDGAVREIYDVAVLPGVACARSVSPLGDDGFGLITVDGSR